MKINVYLIERITNQVLSDYVIDSSESVQYTDLVVEIAEQYGYGFADLWKEDGSMSALMYVIDEVLYGLYMDKGLEDLID